MKHTLFTLSLITTTMMFAQTSPPKDSLNDVDYKKKQIEILEEELRLKKEELEMRKKDAEVEREQKRIELERSKMQLDEHKQNVEAQKQNKEAEKQIEKEVKSKKGYNVALFLEPLPLFVGGFQGGLESKISKTNRLRLSAGYYYATDPWYYSDAELMTGMKFDLQYRHYVPSSDPDDDFSLYYGASVVYKYINITNQPYNSGPMTGQLSDDQGRNINPCLLLGSQVLVANAILIDLWTAAGVNVPLLSTPRERISLPFVNPYGRGVNLRLGLSVGVPIK